MCSGHEAKVAEAMEFFQLAGLTPKLGGRALDLGSGSGFQAIALAQLGFDVIAVDSSPKLLEELNTKCSELFEIGSRIMGLRGDMRDSSVYSDLRPFKLAACLGNSLTHLSRIDDARVLLRNLLKLLEPAGAIVLGFRDLTAELSGTDRIVPLRMHRSSGLVPSK
jgi:SAM-dependent methyltransferase